MSPLQAIKKYCLDCCLGQRGEVKECPATKCPLWTRRTGANQGAGTVKAIRARCIDCSGGHEGMVLNCDRTDCILHPFRMGKNPNRLGVGNTTNLAKFSNSREGFANSGTKEV